MAFGRFGDPRSIAGQPASYLIPCFADRLRVLEYARVYHQPQKGEEAGPWQTDARNTVKLPIEPIPSAMVLSERTDASIDQDIGIDQNQSKSSLSAIAKVSAILLMLTSLTRPRSTDLVRKTLCGFRRAVISRSPRRKASLMTSFRLISRFLRTCSSVAATSSSIVNVVLMHQGIFKLMS